MWGTWIRIPAWWFQPWPSQGLGSDLAMHALLSQWILAEGGEVQEGSGAQSNDHLVDVTSSNWKLALSSVDTPRVPREGQTFQRATGACCPHGSWFLSLPQAQQSTPVPSRNSMCFQIYLYKSLLLFRHSSSLNHPPDTPHPISAPLSNSARGYRQIHFLIPVGLQHSP